MTTPFLYTASACDRSTPTYRIWVWVTGYRDNAILVEHALDHKNAIVNAAAKWVALHHGEILEINSVEEYPNKSTRRRFVRLTSRGVEFL